MFEYLLPIEKNTVNCKLHYLEIFDLVMPFGASSTFPNNATVLKYETFKSIWKRLSHKVFLLFKTSLKMFLTCSYLLRTVC